MTTMRNVKELQIPTTSTRYRISLSLNDERHRLCTFFGSNYLRDSNAISPMLLAHHGFAYSGPGDWVVCVFCTMRKEDWRQYDNVGEIHRVLSPACPMVTGAECGNIPLNYVFGQRVIQQDSALRLERNGIFTSAQTSPATTRQEELMDTSSTSRMVTTSNINTSIMPALPCASANQRSAADLTSHNQNSSTNNIAFTNHLQLSNVSIGQHLVSNHPVNQLPASTISTCHLPPSSSSTNQLPGSNISTNQLPAPNFPTNNSSLNNGISQTDSTANPNSNNDNHSDQPTFSQLNVITARPKRYEYAVRDKRLETFAAWPAHHHITKEQLVDAGFYYAGYSDCGRCFFCGGGMRNWEIEDEPIVEHARWFPKCGFVKQLMGQDFVDAVAHFATDHEKINLQMIAGYLGKNVSYLLSQIGENKERSLTNDSAVKTICEFGYSMEDVLPIAAQLKETMSRSDNFLSIIDLFNEILARDVSHQQEDGVDLGWLRPSSDMDEDWRALNRLRENIVDLRKQTLCKVCLDKEVGVIFLDCKHMVCCSECALAMKDCPVCRNRIKGIVRGIIA